jgi:anaerobic dimethyl sulfoxide reductase subunit B (iron-sulfur subunit)
MAPQFGFSFDLSRCSGCMACVVACMDQNDIPGDDLSYRQLIKLEKGAYPSARLAFVTLACFHCNDAPCARVCPNGAIFRDETSGVIAVDETRCIGCRACAMVCPFGAPRFTDGGAMHKCNLCIDRVAHNMEPACVHTCTTKALGFGSIEAFSRKKAEKASVMILKGLLPAAFE